MLDAIRAGAPMLDGLDEDLRAIVVRSLALEPRDRFPSVDAFRAAVIAAARVREPAGAVQLAAWLRARAAPDTP
jgi:hypothetical protein